MLVFEERGKPEYPEKKPLGARTRTNNKLNPHMTPRPGIEPGPHWWGAGMAQWLSICLPRKPPTQASHQCGPGSIPGLGVKCGLSLLLVLVLAPRGFSPGSPVFPSPQKPTFPNSNSIWNPRATGLSVISLLSVTLVK